MNGFFAVLRREVEERRLLLLAALLAGLFPLVLPYLPGLSGHDPAEVRAGTALCLALVIAGLSAFGLGATIVAGDLAEGRLGFYFARPVGGWALWTGKLAAAAVLSLGMALLVLLPTLLLGGKVEVGAPWWIEGAGTWGLPGLVALLAAAAVAAILLAHAVSIMARSRSPWLLLDLGAAFALAAFVWGSGRRLFREGAFAALSWGGVGLAVAAVAAAFVAGAVQVTRGRTDLRRGHRLLSLTLWAGLGAASLLFSAYSHWVVDVSVHDLTRIGLVIPAPVGSWIGLTGPVARRGSYAPVFLFETASGRSLKIDVPSSDRWWGLQPVFSPDGTRAVWLEAADGGFDLETLDLTRPAARPAATRISFHHFPHALALDPAGRRVAAAQPESVTVDDLATGRLLASVRGVMQDEESVRLRFLDAGHLRICHAVRALRAGSTTTTWQLTILEVDLARGRIISTAQSDVFSEVGFWLVSPDGERALVPARHRAFLLDLRTGKTICDLPTTGTAVVTAFLSDGRILLTERTADFVTLRLLAPGGTEVRRFLFRAAHLQLGGEVSPGRLAVATIPAGSSTLPAVWASILLDLETGQAAPLGRDLLPVGRPGLGPRSAGSRLFLRKGRELLLLEPATGRLRTVLRGRSDKNF